MNCNAIVDTLCNLVLTICSVPKFVRIVQCKVFTVIPLNPCTCIVHIVQPISNDIS